MTDGHEGDPQPALEFTGERFTPECVREIFYEHWHRYAWAARRVDGLRVLDCACGEGYGSALLARRAVRVDGVDLDAATIEHARARYRADNLAFHAASALELPFDADCFDAVVSFETLEHLAEHDRLLTEFRRVLKPGGFLVLSSPDRKTYSDDTGFENEFHVRELYRNELEALLGRYFPNYRLYGQKLMFQSALWQLDGAIAAAEQLTAADDGRVEVSDRPAAAALYFIAVAAADGIELPEPAGLSLFTDRAESVYAHYNDEVGKHIAAGTLLAERDAEIDRLRGELEALRHTAPQAPSTPDSPWQRIRKRLFGR
ncbi:MAG: class I SAM-dependent methyltransferase [Wenzhouxiangellaceae bacterium]|nr:class I SAM-dependent methyltransferase [Wenzhouxiangellaceae bacterium]